MYHITIACIQVDGHENPLLFPVHNGRRARLFHHLLHVCFRFVESSIYIKEERKSKSKELLESIPSERCVEEDGHCWYLTSGK